MRKGHDAWSCDLIDTDVPGKHIIGDAIEAINTHKWDLVIAHPPCTYLAKAGLHKLINNPERQKEQKKAIEFVKAIYNSDVPYIAIENPIGALTEKWQRPTQIVYPWYWGEPYGKDICLWLKNLPPLKYDYNIPKPQKLKSVSNHVNSRMSLEQKRKIKSRFFHSVAEAMAEQWSNLPMTINPPVVPPLSIDPPQLVPRSSPGRNEIFSSQTSGACHRHVPGLSLECNCADCIKGQLIMSEFI